MPNKPKTAAQVAAEKKAAVEKAKAAAKLKPKPAMNKEFKPNSTQKPPMKTVTGPTVTVTAKRTPTKTVTGPTVTVTGKKNPSPTVSKDPYRYFMGPQDMSKPTREVTKSEYEKGGMPRIKILATDTTKINNLERSRGTGSVKGFNPLKTQTKPKKV